MPGILAASILSFSFLGGFANAAPPLNKALPPIPLIEPARYEVVSGEELQKMMKRGPRPVIVDVREPELFLRGRVPGSINIPYEGARKRLLKELDPKEHIVFVCHGGDMGDELGEFLVKNHYKHVYNLKRGIRGWDGPLERGR